MKNILVIGAGKSAVTLIDYLLNESEKSNWNITIADYNLDLALKSTNNHINSRQIFFDIKLKSFIQLEENSNNSLISCLSFINLITFFLPNSSAKKTWLSATII